VKIGGEERVTAIGVTGKAVYLRWRSFSPIASSMKVFILLP
jgi:hypothetical protein